jgi:hypothetical protein
VDCGATAREMSGSSERRVVMPDPRLPSPFTGLNDDQIEPDRQPRYDGTAGQHAPIEQPVRREPDARALAVIHGLLAEAETARRPPTHFDDDERARRTRVDRHEIELVASDMDVPGQDGPTGLEQSTEDQRFGGVTCLLGLRPGRDPDRTFHGATVTVSSARTRITAFAAAYRRIGANSGRRGLERQQVRRVERGIVGHDREQLLLE